MQVKQLHDWLVNWNGQFLNTGSKSKKQNDSGAKKAVLLSGTPGIGKTTTAKVVCKMLGYQAVEVSNSCFFQLFVLWFDVCNHVP